MLLYKKLEINLHDIISGFNIDYEIFKWGNFYEYLTDIKIDDVNKVLDNNFKITKFPKSVNLTKIEPPGVGIHTDEWNAAINIYLTAQSSVTKFYATKHTKTDDQNTFSQDSVELVDQICPQKKDILLINTSIPHSVTIPIEDGDRYILRILWGKTHTFDEIYKEFT